MNLIFGDLNNLELLLIFYILMMIILLVDHLKKDFFYQLNGKVMQYFEKIMENFLKENWKKDKKI